MRRDAEPVMLLGDWNIEPFSDLQQFLLRGRLSVAGLPRQLASGQISAPPRVASPIELPSQTLLKARLRRDGVLHEGEDLATHLAGSDASLFCHQLKLGNAYGLPRRDVRQVSTYHMDRANPDFIFYSVDRIAGDSTPHAESPSLRLVRRLALPVDDGSLCSRMVPWPNELIPSDHIPLYAEFELR